MRVKDAIGRFGEDVACRHLEQAGLHIIERNWRCKLGEIDIVASDAGHLVVVEVKTRSTTAFGSPVEAVDRAKAGRLRRLAAEWLDERRRIGDATDWWSVRIDVIGVVRRPHGLPDVEHIIGAL